MCMYVGVQLDYNPAPPPHLTNTQDENLYKTYTATDELHKQFSFPLPVLIYSILLWLSVNTLLLLLLVIVSYQP